MASPQEYYTSFQAARSAISSRLDALSSDQNPSQDQVAQISQGLQTERKRLNDATAFLPAYDRRSYESQLRELEARVDELRNKIKGGQAKGSFVFKKNSARSGPKATTASLPPKGSPKPAEAGSPVPIVAQVAPTSSLQIASSSHQCFTLPSLSESIPSSNPSDLTINSLDHCIVDLLPATESENDEGLRLRAVHIRDVKNSVLLLGYIQGSILAHNIERCVIVAACHQLRIHNSSRTRFLLHVSSNAVIEDCTNLTFAPYPEMLHLCPAVRHQASTHASIQDFSHVKSTPSPNWSYTDPSHAEAPDWNTVRALARDSVLQAPSASDETEHRNRVSSIERIIKTLSPPT